MIDEVYLYFTFSPGSTCVDQWVHERPAFQEALIRRTEMGESQYRYRGLQIDLWWQQGRGRVKGSLHSFAQGHNCGLFTFTEVKAACEQLANDLALPAESLQVYKIEIGVNLRVPSSPGPFLESLLTHKHKRFWPKEPPDDAPGPLLFYAKHADYKIKLYDKAAYHRKVIPILKNSELLRFEVRFHRIRALLRPLKLALLTLADLADPEVLLHFCNILASHWKLCKRREPKDFTGLTSRQCDLLVAGDDLDLTDYLRKSKSVGWNAKRLCELKKLQTGSQSRRPPHPFEAVFQQTLLLIQEIDVMPC
ncbi:hypothetical protein LRS06_09560 [Hymenobacter sp. J193]|uniref:hypothetical protein n=1 Tax=Hymenobacter sp. J193 TaxID=2898429 RepID=UPI00215175B0|nr:hypothetical protein [Hymenobacter sp. J193]MCR5888016.1 hypothetical protein [Hymenobacter sp. J193]